MFDKHIRKITALQFAHCFTIAILCWVNPRQENEAIHSITRRCKDKNNPLGAASFAEKFHHRFRPRTDLKFFIDIVTMLANRLDVHAKHVGNFFVWQPL